MFGWFKRLRSKKNTNLSQNEHQKLIKTLDNPPPPKTVLQKPVPTVKTATPSSATPVRRKTYVSPPPSRSNQDDSCITNPSNILSPLNPIGPFGPVFDAANIWNSQHHHHESPAPTNHSSSYDSGSSSSSYDSGSSSCDSGGSSDCGGSCGGCD